MSVEAFVEDIVGLAPDKVRLPAMVNAPPLVIKLLAFWNWMFPVEVEFRVRMLLALAFTVSVELVPKVRAEPLNVVVLYVPAVMFPAEVTVKAVELMRLLKLVRVPEKVRPLVVPAVPPAEILIPV